MPRRPQAHRSGAEVLSAVPFQSFRPWDLVRKIFQALKTLALTMITEPTSRRNTIANHHALSSNVPSKVNLAAPRYSRTRGAGYATENNPARPSRRNSFSAAAPGKSSVGQTLLRATGFVSQALGISITVIARPDSPISKGLRPTTTRFTLGRRADPRRQAAARRDDWAVRCASRDRDGGRQFGWTSVIQ